MKPNGKENKIGYGDPECTKDCPIRLKHPDFCNLAVVLTDEQIKAWQKGDFLSAAKFEDLQNQIALKLLCQPAWYRI